jgi:hypothetical protein
MRFVRVALAGATLSGMAAIGLPGGGTAHASGLAVTETWSRELPAGSTGPVISSSPALATIGGVPAAVFGDNSGKLWALNIATGATMPGFPATAYGGGPINSSPSVSGSHIYAGVGNWALPHGIGYQSFGSNGSQLWHQAVDSVWGTTSYGLAGVSAGLSVGNLQGQTAVFGGSLGQVAGAFNGVTGAPLSGFPWFQGDTDAATAALADLYSNGQTEIVQGGASTAGLAFNTNYVNGGHLRVLSATGTQLCNYNTNEEVDSSPAVGQFLPGHAVGIVVGTGDYYKTGSNHDQLLGFNSHCGLQWARTLGGITNSSPAVVNALGNGALQIVATAHSANTVPGTGTVYLLDGSGNILWSQPTLGAPVGGPTSVDLGGGYQDIVATGTQGVEILDGRTGQVLWSAAYQNLSVPMLQNSALITNDPNGLVGITIAGYNALPYDTEVVHYEVAGSNGSLVKEAGGWPEFHHDPQLTGDAGTPAPRVQVSCRPPVLPGGYYLYGADGGMFTYWDLPFCGSTGALALAKPIVGMAATGDAGGYWLVAGDGGIFSFGDAHFYGSTGAVHLARPIVGMAATPDGRGYWLVASDGGLFSFGDARFFGSTGALHLNKPIMGMAATPDGRGYWLVASDGGMFSFGDARFFGSTGAIHLAKPIVGMTSTPTGQGYWLVASDGGMFSFGNAGYHGSTGGQSLAAPIVSMVATQDGRGYWLTGANGAVYSFGDAPYYGSAGRLQLARPVIGMAGF